MIKICYYFVLLLTSLGVNSVSGYKPSNRIYQLSKRLENVRKTRPHTEYGIPPTKRPFKPYYNNEYSYGTRNLSRNRYGGGSSQNQLNSYVTTRTSKLTTTTTATTTPPEVDVDDIRAGYVDEKRVEPSTNTNDFNDDVESEDIYYNNKPTTNRPEDEKTTTTTIAPNNNGYDDNRNNQSEGNEDGNVAISTAFAGTGQYYVYDADGQLQRVTFKTTPNDKDDNNGFTANLLYELVEPVYAYGENLILS